ncbi:ArnT family glycosyltransferase [Pararhizobium mangrovi]|uniref:Glycosyltransferase family 39 protein n=1 Tax=Pararhizobium mangrovi TaxID=2590452 RepID=A0A506U9X8_9HYPH|nr:glycosyltransferase family 39 protein [Pararhizobium mangrovi]TPW29874.1 glycosyltransferase family 39 protein [Pararhizobium mangrovi]
MPARSARVLPPLHALVLVLVSLAAFLPGIANLPPTDRDEARYVQATRQMVESGDYVDIRFQDEPRYKKPVGIYWLQSASLALTGHGADAPIWVYRLVSVLGAALAVLATGWLAALFFGGSAGLFAGIVQASILGLVVEGHIAKTDAFLLATVVFAQAALARIWLESRTGQPTGRATAIVFWCAIGAGALVKGPVGPLVSLLTGAALSLGYREFKWLRRLRPLAGLAIVVLIVAPWLLLISVHSGGAFWRESVGHDLMGKVAGAQESHGAPPGFFAAIFVVFMWPFGSMALRAGLFAITRFRTDPRLAFLLAWYVPYWLVVEAVPTKLPQYILPAYPAVVLALAWALGEGLLAHPFERRWQRWLDWATRAGHVFATIALAAAAIALPLWATGTFSLAGLGAALFALAAGALSSGFVLKRRPGMAIAGAAGSALVTFALVIAIVLPSLKPVWLGRDIANAYEANRPCAKSRLTVAGFEEPSLIFLAGTHTMLTDGEGAARALAADPRCAIAAVTAGKRKRFDDTLARTETKAEPLATIKGFDYSKGDWLTVTLFSASGR